MSPKFRIRIARALGVATNCADNELVCAALEAASDSHAGHGTGPRSNGRDVGPKPRCPACGGFGHAVIISGGDPDPLCVQHADAHSATVGVPMVFASVTFAPKVASLMATPIEAPTFTKTTDIIGEHAWACENNGIIPSDGESTTATLNEIGWVEFSEMIPPEAVRKTGRFVVTVAFTPSVVKP